MDDRTFWLIMAILATSVLVIFGAGIANFDVSPGFWAIPGGIITLLTVRSRGNGNGNGERRERQDAAYNRALQEWLERSRKDEK